MFQTDQATAATSLPTPAAAGAQGYFTNGNPASGVAATIVDADFLNMLMLELINVVEAAGLTPSKTSYNQVLAAIKAMMQQGVTNVGVDTGAANAYVVAFTPALTAPIPWVPFWIKVKTTNTAASTLNATGTAYGLVGSAHQALQGGEMAANGNALVYWNPTLNSGNGEYVLMFCSGAPEQVAPATQSQHAVQFGQVQAGVNYAAAAGTSDALTATLASGLTALPDGFPLTIRAASANLTTTPTLNLTLGTTATGAQTIVKGAGAALAAGDIAGANHELQLTYNAALGKWVLNNPATGVVATNVQHQIQPLSASVSSSALTVTLNPTSLDFRSSTLSSGAVATLSNASALSLTVPSGATLGSSAATAATYAVLAINNGGTMQLGIVNMAGGISLDEGSLISATAISSSATSASTVYSASSVTSMPFRVVGYITATEATAGTWATAPTVVQGASLSLLGFGASLSASGYQKLPGGLILQWGGPYTAPASGGTVAVTFPLAFPNAAFTAMVSTSAAAAQMVGYSSLTKTGMSIGTGAGDTLSRTAYYFAIGY